MSTAHRPRPAAGLNADTQDSLEQTRARMITRYRQAGYRCLSPDAYPAFLAGFAETLVFIADTADDPDRVGPDRVVMDIRPDGMLGADFDRLVDAVTSQPGWRLELLTTTEP